MFYLLPNVGVSDASFETFKPCELPPPDAKATWVLGKPKYAFKTTRFEQL